MRFSTFLPVAALAAVAVAAPNALEARQSSQCNTGSIQCCDSTTTTSDPVVSLLTGLLGIILGPIEAIVGLNCSPINVIGSSGSQCAQQPLCCNNVYQNGLINIGCSPININL